MEPSSNPDLLYPLQKPDTFTTGPAAVHVEMDEPVFYENKTGNVLGWRFMLLIIVLIYLFGFLFTHLCVHWFILPSSQPS